MSVRGLFLQGKWLTSQTLQENCMHLTIDGMLVQYQARRGLHDSDFRCYVHAHSELFTQQFFGGSENLLWLKLLKAEGLNESIPLQVA